MVTINYLKGEKISIWVAKKDWVNTKCMARKMWNNFVIIDD